jgi:hypothetical protein
MVTAADGRALSEGGVRGFTATYPVPLVDPEDDEGHMSAYSSHGPTNDMRRKPDVVAPGEVITSARSDGNVTSFQCNKDDHSTLLPLSGMR